MRETRPKQRLELQLLNLALELLRPLLCPPLQILDLLLHRKDRLLSFLHLEPERFLGFRFRALSNFGLLFEHAFLDRQVELAFLFRKLALLADSLGLRLLRLDKLCLSLLEGLGQLLELLILVMQVDRNRRARFPRFFLNEFLALRLQPLSDLGLHGFLSLFHGDLLRSDGSFALRHFGLF